MKAGAGINVSALIMLLCVSFSIVACGSRIDSYKNSVEKNSAKLYDEYNADLLIWNADDINLSDKLNYLEFNGDNIEQIAKKPDSGYGCIIVINRKGTIALTENMVAWLKKFSEDNHYDIFYYGTSDNELFVRCKLIKSFYEYDRGFFYIVSNKDIGEYNEAGNPNAAHGLWTTDEEEYTEANGDFFQYKMLNDLVYFAEKAKIYMTDRK